MGIVQMWPPGIPVHRRRIGRLALDVMACLILSAVLAVSVALSAVAQEAPAAEKVPLKLQLNRLEPAGEACRITMLIDNARGPALKTYKVDLFAFDSEGVAQKRVGVELGPIPARKTTVKLFEFPGIACAKIGRVLLNDVIACDGGEAAREACLDRTETETKGSVPFDR